MFEITDATRDAAIDAMAEIIGEADFAQLTEAQADLVLGQCFDTAVEIVKRQFGL
jgi:hypothetical protein